MAQPDPFISLLLAQPIMTVQPVTAAQPLSPRSPGRVIGLPVRPVSPVIFPATGQFPIAQPTAPAPTILPEIVRPDPPDEIYIYRAPPRLYEDDEPSFTFAAISKKRLTEADEIYLLRIWIRYEWPGEYDDNPSIILKAFSKERLAEDFTNYIIEHRRDEDHLDDEEFNEAIEALDIEVEDQYFNSAYMVELVKAKMIQ